MQKLSTQAEITIFIYQSLSTTQHINLLLMDKGQRKW